jgi:hypothetical protein
MIHEDLLDMLVFLSLIVQIQFYTVLIFFWNFQLIYFVYANQLNQYLHYNFQSEV